MIIRNNLSSAGAAIAVRYIMKCKVHFVSRSIKEPLVVLHQHLLCFSDVSFYNKALACCPELGFMPLVFS